MRAYPIVVMAAALAASPAAATGGLSCTPVGGADPRIDLAAGHTVAPAMLGVTLRERGDRDRIRQSVLERMGWRIYRIWSTDWFADPGRETRRLLSWLGEQRDAFALDHARRQERVVENNPADRPDPSPSAPRPATVSTVVAAPAAEGSSEPVEAVAPARARERARPDEGEMKALDAFHWYDAIRGHLYEIWLEKTLAGEVEVLRRATAPARLYGGQAVVSRSEYEGRVAGIDERFKTDDMYAAMRWVAQRARAFVGEPGQP